ncbi:MAG TPA: hypothetical protein VMU11_00575 [Verrucomicrobiae bacterium]|nr:hypothetical protein [Verrucomicrobiae bacterium]
MKTFFRHWKHYVVLLFFLGACAGTQRSCSSCAAEEMGANWVVVQMDMNGHAFRCWSLHGVSISNEEHSDGIYWLDSETGNLVHISGNYNRVQVGGDHWDHAYRELGLTQDLCQHIHDHQDLSER